MDEPNIFSKLWHLAVGKFKNNSILIALVFIVCLATPELLILLGYTDFYPAKVSNPEKLSSVFFTLATAIFTGGLFSAITKSEHFIKIYNELIEEIIKKWRTYDIENNKAILIDFKAQTISEIENIISQKMESIYENKKFIESLSLDKQTVLWNIISNVILKNSFPKINSKIQAYVFDTYFPKDDSFYYYDYHLTLNYEIIDKDKKIICVEDERYYTLIPAGNTKFLKHKISNVVEAENIIDYRWNYLEIDGQRYENDTDDISVEIGVEDKFECDGKICCKSYYNLNKRVQKNDEIKIHAMSTRKYILTEQTNMLRVSFRKFVEDVYVNIRHPEELSVEFSETGLLNEFVNRSSTKGLINKEFKDIVFPGQGFIINLDLK